MTEVSVKNRFLQPQFRNWKQFVRFNPSKNTKIANNFHLYFLFTNNYSPAFKFTIKKIPCIRHARDSLN